MEKVKGSDQKPAIKAMVMKDEFKALDERLHEVQSLSNVEARPDVPSEDDLVIFEECTKLLTAIVQGSESPAERIDQLIQNGFLRMMLDKLQTPSGKGNRPAVLEGGFGGQDRCVSAVLTTLTSLLEIDPSSATTTTNFATQMRAELSLTTSLGFCCTARTPGIEDGATLLYRQSYRSATPTPRATAAFSERRFA
jgi:hypothetical protein